MPQNDDKYLIVVVGPTAVGKTSLCIALANYFSTEIISADSRQFYKEMAIGTAKPTKEELLAAPHHFVDSHSVQEEFSAGAFEVMGLEKIKERFESHTSLLLTGGSGLYIQAICEGFDDLPKVPSSIRNALKKEFEISGYAPLQQELRIKDPVYFAMVDQENHQRVIRALEVIRFTNTPFSTFLKKDFSNRQFKCIKIGLERPMPELYERINTRVDTMLESGLLEEVAGLTAFRDKNALQTVGYKEVFDFFDGKYDYQECVRLLKRNTRRYAKRQMTWFRKDTEITWFSPEQPESIQQHILSRMP